MKPLTHLTTTRARLKNSPLLIFFLLINAALFIALKIKTDSIVRQKIPGSSIIYIPSGKFLKPASFGYSALMADVIYLWSIQYYSTPTIDDRFDHLDHIFNIISELDPAYIDPYDIGSLIAVNEARNPDLALKILDTGARKNPDKWIFPFNAGHIAMMTMKDFALAEKYFSQCLKIPGAPEFVERLRANAIFKKGDLITSWETWLDIYNKASDDRTRKIASNHLYNIKQTIDTDMLNRAVLQFKEKYGRFPESLEALVRIGLVREIPQDLDGNNYIYDSQSGKVKAPIIPWRR